MPVNEIAKLVTEAAVCVTAINGWCNELSAIGIDMNPTNAEAIKTSANRLLKIVQELALEASVCKSC